MDLPNGKRGAYDYFIRDYQQNVRMILTEETHTALSHCTMEITRQGNEEPVFGQTGAGNEVALTRNAKPEAWESNTSASVSKLSALTHKAGPNVLLKVMAGDQVSATTNYYYKDPVTNSTGNNLTGPILTSLIQSILGSPATGLAKGNTTNISTQLNANIAFLNKTAPDAGNPTGSNPKAYLTVVFFNERFEFVEEGSTALRVVSSGDGQAPLVIPNIKAPKNGYAYVYLSNENAEAVYFDDFKVAHTRGRIIEENHYYAFGLRIAGISSAKFGDDNEGSLKNEYLYNDKELWTDADLNWYDYGFRNYDPQIGRFPQLDPLTWDYPHYTPYQYAGNEPIANVDLDGLEPFNSIQTLSEVVIERVSTVMPVVAKTSTVTTRIFGGLKAVGGILEAAVGVAGGIATSWTGIGAVGGALVTAHGLDVAASGINQLIFGTDTKSFTEQGVSKGLQIAGMSEAGANQWAGNIDGGISIVGAGYAGGGVMRGAPVVSGSSGAKASSQILSWGNNAKGHLIKHADVLGYGGHTPQQLQKMLPQLRTAANQLYNNINPSLTRIGRWAGQTDDVLMHITNNGKMLVTRQNGEFITVINKTSNNWYQLAKPLK